MIKITRVYTKAGKYIPKIEVNKVRINTILKYESNVKIGVTNEKGEEIVIELSKDLLSKLID